MKKLMISAMCLTIAGVLNAQELAEVATKVSEDNGPAIIAKVEAKADVIGHDEPTAAFVSAEDRVREDLEKAGISEGADPENKAIIQIGTAVVKFEKEPANNSAFPIAREQMLNIASMRAKAEIIKAINADFSAVDRVSMMVDESFSENAEKVEVARRAVEDKRAELAKTLAKYNEADAKSVSEVTLNDRFNSFLDAVIKKIDNSYNPEAIAAKKQIAADAAKAEAEALKAQAEALAAEYKKLEAAAEQLPKDPALESASIAQVMAKMPLLGSSMLVAAESWDKDSKEYQVAVAVVWSPKLQEVATKMLIGDFTGTGKPGKFSKGSWAKAQDWKWMIGTRRFTDDKGRNLFVGISSVELTGPTVTQNGKKTLADTMARKNVAMSLISDLETFTEASQNMKVYADDSMDAAQKLLDNVQAKVNINMKGCMRLTSATVKNPISGKKTYVSAFYIDPSIAAESKDILQSAFEKAIHASKHAKKQFGILKGLWSYYDGVKSTPVVPVPPPVITPQPQLQPRNTPPPTGHLIPDPDGNGGISNTTPHQEIENDY